MTYSRLTIFAAITCIILTLATSTSWVEVSTRSVAPRPKLGLIVHTEYTRRSIFHWEWYKQSVTYGETRREPMVGFYSQDDTSFSPAEHAKQIRATTADFVLMSWYGGIEEYSEANALDDTLIRYCESLSESQPGRERSTIFISILMEFASVNTVARLAWLHKNIYEKFNQSILREHGQMVLALGFGPNDSDRSKVVELAKAYGLFVIDGGDADGGGAAFVGISMKTPASNRVTRLAAVVSPGVDVTGKLQRATHSRRLEPEVGSSPHIAAQLSLPVPKDGGWLILLKDKKWAQRCTWLDCNNVSGLRCGNMDFRVQRVQKDIEQNCKITLSIGSVLSKNITGVMFVDQDNFRPISFAEYDEQWITIVNLEINRRPRFIIVASFNSWEEGTFIEDNNVDGYRLIDRTKFWMDKIRNDYQ